MVLNIFSNPQLLATINLTLFFKSISFIFVLEIFNCTHPIGKCIFSNGVCEQLILFIPSIWFFAEYVHVLGAVALGFMFIIGRALYAVNYVKDPSSRSLGMMLTVLPCYGLVLGALGGAIWAAISLS